MTNALIDAVGKSAPAQARSPEHAVLVQQAFVAIEAATTVEDLTKIRDQWDSIAAYAAKAKDFEIKAAAEEIKARAERKLGQMMQEQKETVGFNKGGRPRTGFSETRLPTLAEAGVDKNLAHRARRQAAKSVEEFEADIAEKKASSTERKRKRKAANTPPAARRSAAKNKINAVSDSKSRTSHVDIIAAWNDAPPEERTRAINHIGLKRLLTALPRHWVQLIEKWLAERGKAEPRPNWDVGGNKAPPIAGVAEQTAIADDLEIPDFLRRDKWPKPEAVE